MARERISHDQRTGIRGAERRLLGDLARHVFGGQGLASLARRSRENDRERTMPTAPHATGS